MKFTYSKNAFCEFYYGGKIEFLGWIFTHVVKYSVWPRGDDTPVPGGGHWPMVGTLAQLSVVMSKWSYDVAVSCSPAGQSQRRSGSRDPVLPSHWSAGGQSETFKDLRTKLSQRSVCCCWSSDLRHVSLFQICQNDGSRPVSTQHCNWEVGSEKLTVE